MNERQSYVQRLLSRVWTLAAAAGPLPPNFGEEMELADLVLADAVDAYEGGQIDREELDSKATGYLNHWRGLCRKQPAVTHCEQQGLGLE